MTALYATLSGHPARVLAGEKILIFPIPQQLEVTDEVFVLDESVAIIVPENSSEKDVFLARFLVRELSDLSLRGIFNPKCKMRISGILHNTFIDY